MSSFTNFCTVLCYNNVKGKNSEKSKSIIVLQVFDQVLMILYTFFEFFLFTLLYSLYLAYEHSYGFMNLCIQFYVI